MTILDQIKERVAYYADLWQREPKETLQHIDTLLTFCGTIQRIKTPLITCKDCKYYSDHEWIIATDVSDVCHFWHGKATKVAPDGFCAWACSRTE